MLAQIALIAFALLALMAVVVDMGLVRITQAQMQTAADSAALEGVRHRDVSVQVTGSAQPAADAFASDCLRRAAARRVVRSMFDADLDPATADPDDTFGAGPIIDLTEGATSLHAYSTISVPDVHVYKPALQLNQPNAVDGDMVSGRFCYSDDPARSEDAGYAVAGMVICTEPQRGFGRYARNDFNPSANSPQGPAEMPACPPADDPPPASWPRSGAPPLNTEEHSAFLVRLRRSNEYRDFGGQTDPDIASSGPSLPLLFGRGAPIHGDDPASDYSVRRDGFTVRATAIAAARPAAQVGLPQPRANQPGVTPFALVDTFVASLGPAPAVATINPALGVICTGTTCAGTNPPGVIGRFVDSLTDPTRVRWLSIGTLGQPLPAPTALGCAAATPNAGYGPVYSQMSAGGNRIIGFIQIAWQRDPARPADACAVRFLRGASVVAPGNATALTAGTLALPAAAPPALVRELLDKHFAREGRLAYGPLLAPALVR